MKTSLHILIGAAGAVAISSLPLAAATSTSDSNSLSSDIRGNPNAGAPGSDATPPGPAKSKLKTTAPELRDDVRQQDAPSGAPASDTLPPKASKDAGRPSPASGEATPSKAPASGL